jgi:hypothetical protein
MGFFHTSEALIKALIGKCQSSMIDSQQMQNRRIQVIDVNRIIFESRRTLPILIHDVIAVFIRPAMFDTTTNATASEPSGKASRMMIATVIGIGLLPLAIDRSSKLTGAYNQSVLQ